MAQTNQTGFVILGGRKIFVSVRNGKTGKWVSEHNGRDAEGQHLPTIERKLKKVRGALEKLTNAKVLAV